MRKSFIVHNDSLAVLDDLTDEQCGQLFKAIKSYQLGEEIVLPSIIKIAFSPFKNQFIRDEVKYQNIVKRNRDNGLKGGRPKNPTEPSGLSGKPIVLVIVRVIVIVLKHLINLRLIVSLKRCGVFMGKRETRKQVSPNTPNYPKRRNSNY